MKHISPVFILLVISALSCSSAGLRNGLSNDGVHHIRNYSFNSSSDITLRIVPIPRVYLDMMKKFDLDKIEDMHEEMADMMAEQEEVQEVLGRDYGVGTYNESELMDELDELDADIVNEKLDNGISAPSYLPQKA